MNKFLVHIDEAFELSPDDFYNLCVKNSDLKFERYDGDIHIMSPTGGIIGNLNFRFYIKIQEWISKNSGFGFDSSTGFQLNEKTVLSPDFSWISESKWQSLTESQKSKFLPIVPDFVVEIISQSDRIANAENKIMKWLEFDVPLIWLISYKDKSVNVYHKGKSSIFKSNENIPGFDILPQIDFKLDDIIKDLP